MVPNGSPATNLSYDRKSELTAFDQTKTGVKGLVDAGITTVPRIFILPSSENQNSTQSPPPELDLPTIDVKGVNEDPIRPKEVIDKVKDVLESWGFFHMVNHGIPISRLEEMMKGVLGFYEEDDEVKKQWYTRDNSGKQRQVYNSNFDLYAAAVTNWRDTFYCPMAPHPPHPHELPPLCRDILPEYSNHVMKLGIFLFWLISEALGLNPNHLVDMGCADGLAILGHYYPSCPQPESTMGIATHTDSSWLPHGSYTRPYRWPSSLSSEPLDQYSSQPKRTSEIFYRNIKVDSAQHKVLANKIDPEGISGVIFHDRLLSNPEGVCINQRAASERESNKV